MSTTMEDRVRQLEISVATQEVVLENITKVVEDNTCAIKELTAVLNKGKGAAWAMAGVYTALGGVLYAVVDWFKA